MSNFELWVKGCELNDICIYELEKSDNATFYKTWRRYCDGRNYFNLNVTFHVWHNDKHVVTLDYVEGYKIYNRIVNEKEVIS